MYIRPTGICEFDLLVFIRGKEARVVTFLYNQVGDPGLPVGLDRLRKRKIRRKKFSLMNYTTDYSYGTAL